MSSRNVSCWDGVRDVAPLQCNVALMSTSTEHPPFDLPGNRIFSVILSLVGAVWFFSVGCGPVSETSEEPVNPPPTGGLVQGVVVSGLAPPVTGGFRSVILFEPDVPLAAPVPADPATMDQFGLAFIPEVLVARVGQEGAFTNGDAELHNVHVRSSASSKTIFNIATPIAGEYLHMFDAGTYTVSCDVHPAMAAYIVVTEAPYGVVADRDGRFELAGISAGRHTVRVWSVDAERQSERVVDIVGKTDLDLSAPE